MKILKLCDGPSGRKEKNMEGLDEQLKKRSSRWPHPIMFQYPPSANRIRGNPICTTKAVHPMYKDSIFIPLQTEIYYVNGKEGFKYITKLDPQDGKWIMYVKRKNMPAGKVDSYELRRCEVKGGKITVIQDEDEQQSPVSLYPLIDMSKYRKK